MQFKEGREVPMQVGRATGDTQGLVPSVKWARKARERQIHLAESSVVNLESQQEIVTSSSPSQLQRLKKV